MRTKSVRDGFMPWAGLALGTAGYFLAHQIGSDSNFQDCRFGTPWGVLLGTLIGIAVIGLGALGSWGIYAAPNESPARRLIAIVGLLACALYVMAVALPFIAAFVIPQCWA